MFDHADEDVARVERWRSGGKVNRCKQFLDTCSHAAEAALPLAICFRLYVELDGPYWLLVVALLRLFPGGIQPWQRYCEIVVRIHADQPPGPGGEVVPRHALRAQSLVRPDRNTTPVSLPVRILSAVSSTLGSPDYLLTLLVCTALDAVPGAPTLVIDAREIPWLLLWAIVTCLHSAAAGIKSTIVYARRLRSLDLPYPPTSGPRDELE
jgi:hypothetical protein